MIATDVDIMALVERVQQTGAAAKAAFEAKQAAHDALKVADEAARSASDEYRKAENALLVAAGGTDMSFAWGI